MEKKSNYTAEVVYTGDLHTNATHLKSGDVISTDAPTDNQGKGEAFSPTDLLAVSLPTCILTVMGIKARSMGVDMSGARGTVKKTMASNPRRVAELEVHIYMPMKDYDDSTKTILEKIAHNCPVTKSLHADLKESITIHW